MATAASILATAGLGLIAFVPLVGLAVLPLQLAAWLMRGFVFEYLALDGARRLSVRSIAGISAARTDAASGSAGADVPDRSHDRTTIAFLSRAARHDAGVGHPQDGHGHRADARHHFVRAGLPGARRRSRGTISARSRAELLSGTDGDRAAVRRRRAAIVRCSRPIARHHASTRGIRATLEQLLVTTGSQQGLDLVARVLLDPGDVVLVELPTYTGAITAFRNVQADMVGVPQGADGIDLDALDATCARG